MYTITVKGSKAEKKKKEYAKIELIFYKPGYNRVPKVLDVIGDFNYWDQGSQHFLPEYREARTKNAIIDEQVRKFATVADQWELEERDRSPIELSHNFDTIKNQKKEITRLNVRDLIEEIIQEEKDM